MPGGFPVNRLNPGAPPADWIVKGVPRIKMAEHLAARKDSTARVIIP
jgi:hypothetical protein